MDLKQERESSSASFVCGPMILRSVLWHLLLAPSLLVAGEFNKVLKIGDPAPAWKELPGTDGKKHSLADHASQELVVVVFTCNSCACSEEYEDRIIAFAKKYHGKVTLVAINVNTIPDDRLEAMKKRAEKTPCGRRFRERCNG